MQEVGGAVERIDDPERVVLAARAAFLREDGVLGVVPADDVDDLPLGGPVDLADVVVAALRRDGERLEPIEAADDDFAGAARGADCDIEERVHVSLGVEPGLCDHGQSA
jgi:hypothetical protein